MTYSSFDAQQQPVQNPQYWAALNSLMSHAHNQPIGANIPGQAAYGSPIGGFGAQPLGLPSTGNWGGFGAPPWGWQQRQLSQQDVGEVVRQLLPLLPQIIAQAQPLAAYAYSPYGQSPYGQPTRALTPQDVTEVVRQILPILPQITGALQGQGQFQPQPPHAGFGQPAFAEQSPYGQWSSPQMGPFQQPLGQQMPFAAAFSGQPWGQQQRQLTQHDIGEVVRQLTAVIPQVIANLQATQQSQTRMN